MSKIKQKKAKKQKYPVKKKIFSQLDENSWGELDMLEPDDILDLHGLKFLDAKVEVEEFLYRACRAGYLKVRIITGAGAHSPDNISVLKPMVINMLNSLSYEHKNADAWHGGRGALDVKLKN